MISLEDLDAIMSLMNKHGCTELHSPELDIHIPGAYRIPPEEPEEQVDPDAVRVDGDMFRAP